MLEPLTNMLKRIIQMQNVVKNKHLQEKPSESPTLGSDKCLFKITWLTFQTVISLWESRCHFNLYAFQASF